MINWLLTLFLIVFTFKPILAEDSQLFLGAGYNDDASCYYVNTHTEKNPKNVWKLQSNDLIEITLGWECKEDQDIKLQGSRIIQMSCSSQKYMILDEYGYQHPWEYTNPQYNQIIIEFSKAHYISQKGLDSLIKFYCE